VDVYDVVGRDDSLQQSLERQGYGEATQRLSAADPNIKLICSRGQILRSQPLPTGSGGHQRCVGGNYRGFHTSSVKGEGSLSNGYRRPPAAHRHILDHM